MRCFEITVYCPLTHTAFLRGTERELFVLDLYFYEWTAFWIGTTERRKKNLIDKNEKAHV